METVHIIDFEGNKRLGIRDFGIVKMQNFEIIDTCTRVCNGDFSTYFDHFLNMRRKGLFAAHSAQTEDSIIRSYWASPGPVPSVKDGKQTLSWGPWVDTKLLYRRLFRDLNSYELDDLINAFGFQLELNDLANMYCPKNVIGFHNALYDALATGILLKNLKNYFPNVSMAGLSSVYS